MIYKKYHLDSTLRLSFHKQEDEITSHFIVHPPFNTLDFAYSFSIASRNEHL